MKTLKLKHQANKAEGRIKVHHNGQDRLLSYDTVIISSAGCHAHVWLGADVDDQALMAAARRAMLRARDIISFSYCAGEPTGFWANEPL